MEQFVTRHRDRIVGILSGFDRVLFRGTLRSLSYVKGFEGFLSQHSVLYKDFVPFAARISERLKMHAMTLAADARRPFVYVPAPQVRKEEMARAIAERDGVSEGLVCVLSCVEPCIAFTIRRDREQKRLRVVRQERKCLHLYFYFLDADFGLMHVRLQTWLPLTIQVCVNGREWLARRLRRAAIACTQVDNCFVAIDDVARAQTFADDLVDWPWQSWLQQLAHHVNPWVRPPDAIARDYYWSVRESEYATDVMFRDATTVQQIYPALVQHGIQMFHSEDVLRFLGHRRSLAFSREVTSDMQRRAEGVRLKHTVHENSIKMYDKATRIVRIETTINNAARFKVRRETPSGQLTWQTMRKGIADIRRRAAIGRSANARYLDALSVVGDPTPSHRLLDPVSQRVIRHGRPYRALRPISPQDAPLFRVILRGEFSVQGFQNRDLRRQLDPDADVDAVQRRQASARMTRHLRLLRAHGLIKKIARTGYYRVTDKGHRVMATAIRFRDTNLALLAA